MVYWYITEGFHWFILWEQANSKVKKMGAMCTKHKWSAENSNSVIMVT